MYNSINLHLARLILSSHSRTYIEQGIVIAHKELRCPECRVLVETRLDELPSNILLIRLLEGIKIEGIKNNGKLVSGRTHVKTPTSAPQDLLTGSNGHSPVHHARVAMTRYGENGAQISQHHHQRNQTKPVTTANLPRAKALFNYDGKEEW